MNLTVISNSLFRIKLSPKLNRINIFSLKIYVLFKSRRHIFELRWHKNVQRKLSSPAVTKLMNWCNTDFFYVKKFSVTYHRGCDIHPSFLSVPNSVSWFVCLQINRSRDWSDPTRLDPVGIGYFTENSLFQGYWRIRISRYTREYLNAIQGHISNSLVLQINIHNNWRHSPLPLIWLRTELCLRHAH